MVFYINIINKLKKGMGYDSFYKRSRSISEWSKVQFYCSKWIKEIKHLTPLENMLDETISEHY